MVMTDLFEKSIQILELPKVLERLAGQAVTQEGMSVLELTLFELSSFALRALATSVAFALPVRAFSAVCIRADN